MKLKILTLEERIVLDAALVGTIAGLVWNDANGDGNHQTNEPGSPGITVKLLDQYGTQVKDANNQFIQTQTDSNGNYQFTGIAQGESYRIGLQIPDSLKLTKFSADAYGNTLTDNQFNLTSGYLMPDYNTLGPYSVGATQWKFVYRDTDPTTSAIRDWPVVANIFYPGIDPNPTDLTYTIKFGDFIDRVWAPTLDSNGDPIPGSSIVTNYYNMLDQLDPDVTTIIAKRDLNPATGTFPILFENHGDLGAAINMDNYVWMASRGYVVVAMDTAAHSSDFFGLISSLFPGMSLTGILEAGANPSTDANSDFRYAHLADPIDNSTTTGGGDGVTFIDRTADGGGWYTNATDPVSGSSLNYRINIQSAEISYLLNLIQDLQDVNSTTTIINPGQVATAGTNFIYNESGPNSNALHSFSTGPLDIYSLVTHFDASNVGFIGYSGGGFDTTPGFVNDPRIHAAVYQSSTPYWLGGIDGLGNFYPAVGTPQTIDKPYLLLQGDLDYLIPQTNDYLANYPSDAPVIQKTIANSFHESLQHGIRSFPAEIADLFLFLYNKATADAASGDTAAFFDFYLKSINKARYDLGLSQAYENGVVGRDYTSDGLPTFLTPDGHYSYSVTDFVSQNDPGFISKAFILDGSTVIKNGGVMTKAPVLWGVNESDGHLFAIHDNGGSAVIPTPRTGELRADPINYADYGLLKLANGTALGEGVKGIAVDESGNAYLAVDKTVSGVTTVHVGAFNVHDLTPALRGVPNNVVDLLDITGVTIGSHSSMTGMAINPVDGKLYGLLNRNGGFYTDQIIKFNTSTISSSEIQASLVSTLPLTNSQDMTFDAQGNLYISNDLLVNNIWRVKLNNGSLRELINLDLADVQALAWNPVSQQLIGMDNQDDELVGFSGLLGDNTLVNLGALGLNDVQAISFQL